MRREEERERILGEVIYDGFGWFDKPVTYDNARLVVDDADPGEFLAVFCHYVGASRACSRDMTAHHLQSTGYSRERCLS